MDIFHHRVTENTEKSIQAKNNLCALCVLWGEQIQIVRQPLDD
jgi:hypothetical protein